MALCRPVARPGWREVPPPAHTEGPASRAGAPGLRRRGSGGGGGDAAATTTVGPDGPGRALEDRVGKARKTKGERERWGEKFYF